MRKLPFWCQKVLPLVYDGALSYYEAISKVVAKLNELINWSNGVDATVSAAGEAANEAEDKAIEAINTANEAKNIAQDIASDIPTKTSDLQNDSGFVNQNQAASAAPVQSVDGKTGDVISGHYGYAVYSFSGGDNIYSISISEITQIYDGLVVTIIPSDYNAETGNTYLKINNLEQKPVKYSNHTNNLYAVPPHCIEKLSPITLIYKETINNVSTDCFLIYNFAVAKEQQYGLTKLSSSLNSTSEVSAASSKALKDVKDMIPTKTSELTNDSNFITREQVLTWPNVENTMSVAQVKALAINRTSAFLSWEVLGQSTYSPTTDINARWVFMLFAKSSSYNCVYFMAYDTVHNKLYINDYNDVWHLLSNVDDRVTESYTCPVVYSSGTIGTRAVATLVDCTKTGYSIEGFSIMAAVGTADFIPVLVKQNGTQSVYVIAYRASTSSVSAGSVTFSVSYTKSN